MHARTKALLIAALIVFFVVDDYQLWVEADNFPFCSHGLFNTTFEPRTKLLRMIVHDNRGHSAVVDSGRVIPIEWYRAVGLAQNVLVDDTDEQRKEQFARVLLDRLNRDPWYAFDEAYASIRPSPGARFVGLDVVLMDYDLDQYQHGEPLAPLGQEQVFSYRMPEAR